MKKILVLVFSDLKHDARVMRHINFLQEKYLVTVVAFDAEPSELFRFIKLPKLKLTIIHKAISGTALLLGLYSLAYRILYPYQFLKKQLTADSFDLIIANDVETLSLAFEIAAKKSKVIFDAHEYAPRHFENVQTWRIFFQSFNIHLCKKYIPQVSAMITVGKKIAEEYNKNFGKLPEVITNAPGYQDYKIKRVGKPFKLVHHGIATPSRKIEIMIEMMRILPDYFTLDLILMTPHSASAKTRRYVEEMKLLARFTDRIRFIPPVKIHDILPLINQYDIGIINIPPINFNYANSLPNKFFDYMQARVALAIGPTPEMAELVRKYDLGVVSEHFTPESLAEKLMALSTRQIEVFKQHAEIAAHEQNAEKKGETLLRIVRDTIEVTS